MFEIAVIIVASKSRSHTKVADQNDAEFEANEATNAPDTPWTVRVVRQHESVGLRRLWYNLIRQNTHVNPV